MKLLDFSKPDMSHILSEAHKYIKKGGDLFAFARNNDLEYPGLYYAYSRKYGSVKNVKKKVKKKVRKKVKKTPPHHNVRYWKDLSTDAQDEIISLATKHIENGNTLSSFVREHDLYYSDFYPMLAKYNRVGNIQCGLIDTDREKVLELYHAGKHTQIMVADELGINIGKVGTWLRGELTNIEDRCVYKRVHSPYMQEKIAIKLEKYLEIYKKYYVISRISEHFNITKQAVSSFLIKYGWTSKRLREEFPSPEAIKKNLKRQEIIANKTSHVQRIIDISDDWVNGMKCKDIAIKYKFANIAATAARISVYRSTYGEDVFPYRLENIVKNRNNTQRIIDISNDWINGMKNKDVAIKYGMKNACSAGSMIANCRNKFGDEMFPRRKRRHK